MTCCPPISVNSDPVSVAPLLFDGQVSAGPWVRGGGDEWHLDLMVPGIHCAGCIRNIEAALKSRDEVTGARVNFSTKRVSLDWRGAAENGDRLLKAVTDLGYKAQPYNPDTSSAAGRDPEGRSLLIALAVAGFAAGNVMLLSISVWSGADAATRELFHWLSALIALPAIAWSARPFFHSAVSALAARRLNMDVPISLAIVLAATVSLFETINGGAQIYFDASITLVFFLLIGRYLDHLTRSRARSVASDLMALQGTAATIIDKAGNRFCVRASELRVGHLLFVAPGERIAADGRVIAGRSDLDRSMVTGETVPEAVGEGALVHAGMLNLSGPLRVEVTSIGENTLLAEIVRLMEAAEQGRARQVRIADRAAQIYAPAVHLLALIAFAGWIVATGDFRQSVLVAVSVLIITCPCALGLAVPAVQVAAAGALMRLGVLVKGGEALEALAGVDHVVFDKTGTLTLGKPKLVSADIDPKTFAIAASLAGESRHPLAQALARSASASECVATDVQEHPGEGLTGRVDGQPVKLGSKAFVTGDSTNRHDDGFSELWCRTGDGIPARFCFEDVPREDAKETIAALKARGLKVQLISGDLTGPVGRLAASIGIGGARACVTPDGKLKVIKSLRDKGHNVLMVGDGINDAPALAAANVSMSPSSAVDVSQTAAGLVFLSDRLGAIVEAIDISRRAHRLVQQNFGIAIAYNIIAVPAAMAGLASPLIAAVAMSTSSILVTANALRVALRGKPPGSPRISAFADQRFLKAPRQAPQ